MPANGPVQWFRHPVYRAVAADPRVYCPHTGSPRVDQPAVQDDPPAAQTVAPAALASADNTLEDIEPDSRYSSEAEADRPRYLPGFLSPLSPPTLSVRAGSQELQPLVATPRTCRTGKSFQEQLASIVQAFMGPQWVRDRLRAEPAIQARFTVRQRRQQLHPPTVAQYFQQVVQFKEKLAVLVQRNIFIEDGLVAVVSVYHKRFYASNDIKVIYRYLPREVGELVVCTSYRLQPTGLLPAGRMRSSGDPIPGRGINGYPSDCAYRELAIGISRRFMRLSSAFVHNCQEEQEVAVQALNPDAEDGMDLEQ
ncbi:uncharacterized protein KD926_003222 [Aspergillus affinis]|uniref:uncharacterized protein n=1 Tax=Aspergillus affinis TaxID=1070780 RepID=UPI0022FDFC32|nr:uncharacterized protein KD926_003222 [Aspergillus affinis]KAI9035593.1 hypothetical protein KD926_003222 [Aspergillus affinis]